jgi:hypothetical protein
MISQDFMFAFVLVVPFKHGKFVQPGGRYKEAEIQKSDTTLVLQLEN